MIQLENLSKEFHTDSESVHALVDVSLDIPKGSIYGIIGYSGAGKSTLIRTINLLEKPDKGKVFINGNDITAFSPKELEKQRQKIGMIFQHFNLLRSKTVYENIAFPLKYLKKSKKEIDKRVNELLEIIDLKDKWEAYPSQLSGGQKQRVAIARALANSPDILLCDEATSALDPQTTASILQLLQKLNRQLGITIVLITHQMSVIKDICDKVAVMENGRIVEKGNTYDVFANPKQNISRKFVNTVFHNDDVEKLLEQENLRSRLNDGIGVYRLVFRGENANNAYIADLIRRFQLNISVIYGAIEIIQKKPIGNLYVMISGSETMINKAIMFLQKENVSVYHIETGDYKEDVV